MRLGRPRLLLLSIFAAIALAGCAGSDDGGGQQPVPDPSAADTGSNHNPVR
jgi:hypothetical protein